MAQYRQRIADIILDRKLESKGAVLIEGAKWCGKTTTAAQKAGSILYMANADELRQNLQIADMKPSSLLIGKTPRLIDEWQVAPRLWDAVRFEVDRRGLQGQFILTGSAVPTETELIQHTGTGRFAWITMRTMSLYESGESSGEVSLEGLFDSPSEIFATNRLTLDDIAYLICRGGWPLATTMGKNAALEQAYDYYDAIVKADVSRADATLKNSERTKRIMRSYARHQGAQVPIKTIQADLAVNESDALVEETVSLYINALRKIFVIEDVAAWNPNLRSKTAVRTADTRYFSDPSIGVAALGLGEKDLLGDLNTMGLFFETLCIRDLRVFADALNGTVYHYRDKNGLECDAVIHLRNGSYGLVEIKLGGDNAIEEGAKTLNKLSDKIDTTKMKQPSFKMVLTAVGSYAFRRNDGVYVVPIGCLKN
ncbi:MAG: ATP-binding protein [Bacteroidales bacterium]|nr:ATP-binding protein [Bacteroidales bacterium]